MTKSDLVKLLMEMEDLGDDTRVLCEHMPLAKPVFVPAYEDCQGYISLETDY